MNKIVALVLLLLVLGAIAWWILKDRPKADAPYGEALLGAQETAGIRKVEGDFRALHQALSSYATFAGSYPQKNMPAALSPTYIVRVPMRDPWGTAYRYAPEGPDGYRLESAGPDRRFGTGDDVVSETGDLVR